MNIKKKRRLKRNRYYRYIMDGEVQAVFMPSDATICPSQYGGVAIFYPCMTRRWISNTWYNDINTDTL